MQIKGNCSSSQHVILSEIAVSEFCSLGCAETLIRRFHGSTSSLAGYIQLQRFELLAYGISATPLRGAFVGLWN